MKLQTSSTSFLILEHIFNSPVITKKQLVLAMGGIRAKSNVQNGLKKLFDLGYIQYSKRVKVNSIELSREGKVFLFDSDNYYYDNRDYIGKAQSNNLDVDMRKSDIMSMCYGAGIVTYPHYKPSLIDLVSYLTNKTYVYDEEEIDNYFRSSNQQFYVALLRNGVFYSSTEVRKCLSQLNIGEEQTYRSRFFGIVFTETNIYVLYHDRSSLIKWVQDYEKVLLDTLAKMLMNNKQHYIRSDYIAVAIGSRNSLYPALVMGYKRGRVSNIKSLDNEEAERNIQLLSGRQTLFSQLYFSPLTISGVKELAKIFQNNLITTMQRADDYFRKTDGFLQISHSNIMRGDHKETNYPAVYLDLAEVESLYNIRANRYKVIVCTTLELSELVSHALGECLISIYDIKTNQPIPNIVTYNRYGKPTNIPDRFQILSEKIKARKGTTIPKKIITLCLDQDVADKLTKAAKKSDVSFSKYVGNILAKTIEEQNN